MVSVAEPTQPWQVSLRHVAPTAAEFGKARQRGEDGGFTWKITGQGFQNRHAAQQQIIVQQRKLLKEQQDQITQLKGEQSVIGLELEAQKTAPSTWIAVPGASRQKSRNFDSTQQR